MDVFIHYAIAASQFAVDDAGLVIGPENATRVGVFIASGIGGFATIEREHKALLEGGPRKISPFFIPAAIINLAAGPGLDPVRRQGPESRDLHGLLGVGARDRRGLRDHPARRRRRDDRRRLRGGHHADGRRRVRRHARAVDAQRRARAGEPSRSTRTATGSSSARAPASSSSRSSSRRRAAARAIYAEVVGYGMTADAYHITAPSEDGDGAMRVHGGRRSTAPASAPTDVEYINAHGTSTPFNDKLETLAIRTLLRRARRRAGRVVHQVDDRAPARRGRRPRSRHHGAGRLPPDRCRRPSTTTRRTRSATWTTCPWTGAPRAHHVRAVELLRVRRHQRRAAAAPFRRADARGRPRHEDRRLHQAGSDARLAAARQRPEDLGPRPGRRASR